MSVNYNYNESGISSGTYSPLLLGATSNPTVNYTTQVGNFTILGQLCFFNSRIVTSSITKTSLNDPILVSLPVPRDLQVGAMSRVMACAYNAIPVQTANTGRIASGASVVELWQQGLTSLGTTLTYALLTGIGLLSSPVTIEISGCYPIVGPN